ncbi:conserved exported hypothetical protein [uncultured delta proteobacterium]|uniref:Transglycosylase SLT domain-containing protein n=1 Tax=uncultured delta proteobacterium TaxID=34034 RepID=A0A212K8Y8_9DELT|nr:conserved exported hypothetical protein [uncultured delta proteobacterium]
MSVAHFIIYMCAALCLLPGAASANSAGREKVALPQAAPLTADCVAEAARVSDLPLAALIGILATENGRTGEALQNNNGTWDMGPFQVNTTHINELVKMGIAPEAVLQDGCTNAYAAAWLLRKEYNRTGNIWQAIGAYHSRTPHRRDAYIAQVKSHLARLRRSGIFALPLFTPDSASDTMSGRESE